MTNYDGPSFGNIFFSFKGRINRVNYWIYSAIIAIIDAIFIYAGAQIAGEDGAIIGLLVALILTLWPHLALNVKRCHDRDRPGAFYLVLFVPVLNIWYLIEMFVLKGSEGDNQYGADPVAPGTSSSPIPTDTRPTTHPLLVSGLVILTVLLASFGWVQYFYEIYLPSQLDRRQMVVELDWANLFLAIAQNKDAQLEATLNAAENHVSGYDADFINIFANILDSAAIDPAYYYDATSAGQADFRQFLQHEKQKALTRTTEVLHERLDQFGLLGLNVRPHGDNQILVEVAVEEYRGSLSELVEYPGTLEFRLLKNAEITQQLAVAINDYLSGHEWVNFMSTNEATSLLGESSLDDTVAFLAEDLLFVDDSNESEDKGSGPSASDLPLDQTLFWQDSYDGRRLLISGEDETRFNQVIQDSVVKKLVQSKAGNTEFLMGRLAESGYFYYVYLVEPPELTGASVLDAVPTIGASAEGMDTYEISLRFNDEGATNFARITGENIGRSLAIVLSNRVASAPIIQTRIMNGRARITGLTSMDEARDLATVLRAGPFPTTLKVVSEKRVERE